MIVRPFNNYGPHQHPEKVVPRFITQALAGVPLTIHGDGHASRDWLYVDDHAEAIEVLIESPIDSLAGEVVNVATGVDISVAEIADLVLECVGDTASTKVHVPERLGQVDRHIGSTDKMAALTGWRARTGVRRRSRADRRLVSRERGLVAEHRRSQPARLLVLGAGAAQLGLLEAAAARDVTVIAVDSDPVAVGFALADERAVISSEDEQGIERLARARAVDGVISPGADWPVGIAARVAERLGLPHPIDGATAVLATTKTRQRERFAATGVLQPRTFSASDPAIPFPCVVKAPDRQGQRGLTLVHEPSALASAVEAAIGRVSRRRRARRGADRRAGIDRERRLPGRRVLPAHGDRQDPCRPAGLRGRARARLAERPSHRGRDRGRTCGRCGTRDRERPELHPDPARPGGRPYVVEVAARLGGGHDAELCRAALGVDLNDLAISFALGEDPRHDVSRAEGARSGGACVLFLVAPEGVLRATEGVEEAEGVEGVDWVRTYRRPGWRFGPLRRGADRAGAILATGDDRDGALARARRAAQAVRFLVDANPS